MTFDISFWVGHNLIVVITVILLSIFLIQNRNLDRPIKRLFASILICIVIEAFCSSLDEAISEQLHTYSIVRAITSGIGYCIRPTIMYHVLLIMFRDAKNKKVKYYSAIPLLICLAITLPSIKTEWVYGFNENNHWHGGPFSMLPSITLFIYAAGILISAIIYYRRSKWESLIVFTILTMLIAEIILEDHGIINFEYREIIISMSVVAYFMYFQTQNHYDAMQSAEIRRLAALSDNNAHLLSEAIEALSYSIDIKDRYTRGHSFRVATYSRMLARMAGKSEEVCQQVYNAGLLHDIGKIGIPDAIINKEGRLTDEEFAIIKTHPDKGAEILSRLKDIPYIQDGAHYHHEKYNGTGYPEGLAGKGIPMIGRIIAVADAYDAMTSKRSYRDIMSQKDVRFEIEKGIGTQFDPKYALLMLKIIDEDVNYDYKEDISSTGFLTNEKLVCEDFWATKTDGFELSDHILSINFRTKTFAEAVNTWDSPEIILFGSDDGKVGKAGNPGNNNYHEYAVIRSDAYAWKTEALSLKYDATYRKMWRNWETWIKDNKQGTAVKVTAARLGNLIQVKMENSGLSVEAYAQVPEGTGKVFLSLTGEHCVESNVDCSYSIEVISSENMQPEDTINFDDFAIGDIPNLKCDGWWRVHSIGLPLTEKGLDITMDTQSYETARRSWDTPLLVLFTSADRLVNGAGYKEYMVLRSDGGMWNTPLVTNAEAAMDLAKEFGNEDIWLNTNKKGTTVSVKAERNGTYIGLTITNSGRIVTAHANVPDSGEPVYLSITGEQCMISNIQTHTS